MEKETITALIIACAALALVCLTFFIVSMISIGRISKLHAELQESSILLGDKAQQDFYSANEILFYRGHKKSELVKINKHLMELIVMYRKEYGNIPELVREWHRQNPNALGAMPNKVNIAGDVSISNSSNNPINSTIINHNYNAPQNTLETRELIEVDLKSSSSGKSQS